MIGCGSKGPTDRAAHPAPDELDLGTSDDTIPPTTAEETPEDLIQQLEDEYRIPKLDRTQTLAGIDDDKNGIRDDIDLYIDDHFSDLAAPAQQLARALQASLLVDREDPVALGEVAMQIARAVDCVDRSVAGIKNEPAPPDVLDDLQAITANTRLRMIAYLLFNQALDGTLTFPLEGEDVCQ